PCIQAASRGACIAYMTRILLIEDEPEIRETIGQVLRTEGFAVIFATDGQEGFIRALAERPDLILCDVGLSGLDGYGVLRATRANFILARTPFIFLTARATIEELRAGMNHGADDYLIKPVTPEDLLASIRARLDRAR